MPESLRPEDIDPFFRDDEFFQITVSSEHTLSALHHHNFLQIWYVLKGSFRHVIDGREHIQREGDLLILPPYIYHQLDTRESENISWVFLNAADNFYNTFPEGMTKNTIFNLTCLRPLMYSLSNVDPFLHFSGDAAEKLCGMFHDLLEEFDIISAADGETPSVQNIRADFARLLTFIAEEYTAAMPQEENAVYAGYRAGLRNAFDYIDSNYTCRITLEDVCREAMLSRSSLTYIFRRMTGKSVVEYINGLRVRKAKRLLLQHKTVTQACYECGFNDVTHFCRTFKKIVGCTPREFAKPQK